MDHLGYYTIDERQEMVFGLSMGMVGIARSCMAIGSLVLQVVDFWPSCAKELVILGTVGLVGRRAHHWLVLPLGLDGQHESRMGQQSHLV